MTFKEPAWLILSLLPLIFIGLVVYNRSRSKQTWKALVAPKLKKELVQSSSPAPFWLSLSLLCLGFILLAFSLAQPITGSKTIKSTVEGRNIFFAIDLSRSMLVQDTKPDRLTAAKTAAIELVDLFPQDRLGVISFAGNAWIEAPLTIDHGTLKETILSLNENSIPYGGSNQSAPLELILEEQADGTIKECVVILLSDGEFHNDFSNKTVSEAKNNGVTVYTLGFGTTAGDLVPDKRERQGLFLNRSNRPVLSRIDEAKLRKIARSTNGRYYSGQDYSFLKALKSDLSDKFNQSTAEKSMTIDEHVYQFFLVPALLFIFLSALIPSLWRQFSLNTVLIGIGLSLMSLQPVEAASKGLKEYKKGNFEKAAELFSAELEEKEEKKARKLQFSEAAANYKREGYESSLESFSKSLLSNNSKLQEDAHYNIGNTLYKKGGKLLEKMPEAKSLEEQVIVRSRVISDWKDSLGHYRSTLHLNSKNQNARENYETVKKALDQLEEEQRKDQMQMQQQSKPQPQEGEEGEDGEPQDGSEGDPKENLTPEQLEKLQQEEAEKKENGQSEPEEKENSEGGDEDTETEQKGQKEDGSDESRERRAGETEEEFASRILEENSDFEAGELKTNRRKQRNPSKDW